MLDSRSKYYVNACVGSESDLEDWATRNGVCLSTNGECIPLPICPNVYALDRQANENLDVDVSNLLGSGPMYLWNGEQRIGTIRYTKLFGYMDVAIIDPWVFC